MQVNSVTSFQGVYVDFQEASGNIHKYVRLEPEVWLWINSAYAQVDPDLSTQSLEDAYIASLNSL